MTVVKRMTAILLVMALWAPMTHAGIAVIVHPDNPSELTERQIKSLFLGKTITFPDGSKARILDLDDKEAIRKEFLKKALRKSVSNFNSRWARLLFSSKAEPPITMANQAEMISSIAKRRDAIGFVDSSKVDSSVKVLKVYE